MNESRVILVIGVLLTASIITGFAGTVLASEQPKLPHAFSGDLTIYGPSGSVPAPIGTEVVAKVGGEVRGRLTTIEEGAYGDIDDIEVPDLYVGEEHYIDEGATIEFYANGIKADQTATFESGADTKLNLTVHDTAAPVVTIYPVTTPTNVDTQTVTGTFDEAFIDTIIVNDVTATIDEDAGTYSAAGVLLGEGTNTITAEATDLVGNVGTATATIVLDTIKPMISDISASGVTSTGATITWTTDELATSKVEYGTSEAYGLVKSDATFTTSHSITLTGLSAGTTYHYRVKSADAATNENVSTDHTFTTATPPSADFSISVSPTSGSVVQGSSTTATVSVSSVGGFSNQVTLSYSGLPSGATASLNPTQVTPTANGTATSTLTISTASTTPVGTYTITITGTGGGKAHSCTYTLTVTAVAVPDFSIGVSPASGSVAQGGSTTATVSISSIAGFTSTVSLSASGATAGFSPSSVTPPANGTATSTLTISTASTTPAGTYTITITGTDGGKTHSCTYTLTVTAVAVPDFSISVSPTSGSAVQGGSTTATVSVSSIEGFSSTVSLSASSSPSGPTTTFSSSSGTPSFTSTLTISTASTTPAGTYTITITGTDGGKTHSCTYTLTVSGLPPPPTSGEIENMAPEDAAEILAASDPESAADTLEDVAPEHAGGIIDAAVEAGLTEEFADILRRMTPSSAASALLNANPANAAQILELIVQNYPEIAAEIADAGAKDNLGEMASILNEMDSDSVATLLTDVFDLPETPKTAADLLGAISLDKSIAVTQILLDEGMYAYVNGMFVHLTDEKLNDIWEGLTQQQRDALLPYLSSEVKDRITALKPSPWTLVAGIMIAIVIVIIIVALLYRRRPEIFKQISFSKRRRSAVKNSLLEFV